jgi:anti-sigma B factor antagonist
MKIESNGENVCFSEIKELSAANSGAFREKSRAALPQTLKTIEIDLSQTHFVDSCGLGALISLYKAANHYNGDVTIRLLNPAPSVQQLFELTRMHRIFEIVQRS